MLRIGHPVVINLFYGGRSGDCDQFSFFLKFLNGIEALLSLLFREFFTIFEKADFFGSKFFEGQK